MNNRSRSHGATPIVFRAAWRWRVRQWLLEVSVAGLLGLSGAWGLAELALLLDG